MKILSIPTLAHDASICILEDGLITSYKMEERFSRKKHDLNFDYILDLLIRENYSQFDKIIITQHFLENFTYSLEKVKEKLSKISYQELVIEKERHHLYHAYSGFYNSGFDEAICFSVDGSGAILNNGEIEIESVYHLNKDNKEAKLYQRTREFKTIKFNNSFWQYIFTIDQNNLSVGEKFCKYSEIIKYDIHTRTNQINRPGSIRNITIFKNDKQV
jgi:predicted NodU family carbamoyl transferase